MFPRKRSEMPAMDNLLFHYVLSYALVGITLGIIAGFVYLQDKKNPLYRTFALYNLAIAWWCFFSLPAVLQHNPNIAVYWCRTFIVGAIFIPTIFFHFTLLFLGIIDKYKRVLKISYLFSFIFLLFDFTPLFIRAAESKTTLLSYTVAGPAFNIHVVHFFIIMFFGEILLLKRYLKEKHTIQGTRILYYLSTGLLATIGGGANYFPVYRMEVPPLNPFGTYFLVVYGITVAYIILRYGFLEIQLIIKKTLIFAGLFTMAYAIFALFALLGQTFLEDVIRWNRWFAIISSIFVIVLALRPLENFLTKVTNKYLFQKKYDPTQLIKTFTDEVITLTDLDKLARTTITTLVKTLSLESSAILLSNRNEDKYEMRDFYGIPNTTVAFDANSPFSKYVSKVGDALVLSEKLPAYIKDEMKKVNAKLVLPLMLHKQMIGMIALGKKKSDQDYTEEDLDILMALAKAEAIALSNARLFSDAKQNVKLAAIGALAAGINHEVCNPLNRMMSAMQIFLKSKQMGLYRDKSEKELAGMSDDIMENTMNDIRKIANITRKLSDFAKPSREVTTERVNIVTTLRDTMDVLGHEIELKRIIFDENVQGSLFTMADKDQLQEIFFNIIRNAIQATPENGKVSFSAKKKDGKLVVNITDTGQGIPDDKLDKIFNPFYSTKEKGEGTGLGLAIVRQLVYRNKGDIRVESQAGKGTTFMLEFPEAENG